MTQGRSRAIRLLTFQREVQKGEGLVAARLALMGYERSHKLRRSSWIKRGQNTTNRVIGPQNTQTNR